MDIDLVPFGNIDPGILQELKDGLKSIFGCPIQIDAPIPVPGQAFDPARDQYLSDDLIHSLRHHKNRSAYVLGITEIDIFTHGLNFVFGQADSTSRVALISLNQLRGERSLKEAVHELGHTMGLGHCKDSTCVMHFSNSLMDTDVKGSFFCSRCQPKLIV